jgi:hypothetical protein
MICDHHIYYDEGYFNIDDYISILKKNKIDQAILSSPCTLGKEPKKSEFMYFIQRKILLNKIGYIFSKKISKSFYNDDNELKLFWRLFSGNKNLKKIIIPQNQNLYDKIFNKENLKMWYWINPSNNLEIDFHNSLLKKMGNKVFGLKFHLYWHNYEISKILKYQELSKKYDLPIYIIMNYIHEDKLIEFLKNNNFKKILFGYGGFPMFNNAWKNIVRYENCYIDIASNHIDKSIIKKILKIFPQNKIIFASDCPYNFEDKNGIFDYFKFNQRIISLNSNTFNSILNNNL